MPSSWVVLPDFCVLTFATAAFPLFGIQMYNKLGYQVCVGLVLQLDRAVF